MALQILTWFLFFALFYLLVTSIILIRNMIDLTSLSSELRPGYLPKISVCIPARNEEKSIGLLLRSLENQDWPDYDVHVLDDRSSDQTFEIAQSFHNKTPTTFFVHRGKEKPPYWLGKPWACHQLSEKTDAPLLLFLDADTTLQPGTLKKIAASFQKYSLDMLTVWPKQKMLTFWEKTIIPIIYHTLLSLLPAIYVYRDPKWMPGFLRQKVRPAFAAACGQCLAFKREAYDSVGGHKAVSNKVIEDVELAKRIKKKGLTLRMFDGIGSVSCRMYSSQSEIFDGLRKNFLIGFNESIPAFVGAGILHLIVFVLPFITLLISFAIHNSLLIFLSSLTICLILFQRLLLASWYQMNPLFSVTHPIGVLWFEWLAFVKLQDYFGGRSTTWKGRKV
ncbi:MAG: glycosyltransferase family 2 protein [Brumimicrobium sp.]|nr:glycosyltransferase family 2 protein [Brumimicrobium sp.]